MFDEREALVAAVATNPDDDTPRLVFADWLQEHGEDDRAEFIRLQCEATRSELPKSRSRRDTHPKRLQWDRRVRELFAAGWPKWFAPFFAALGAGSAWPDRYRFLFADSTAAWEHATIADRAGEEFRDAEPLAIGRLFVARGFGSWLLIDRPDRMPTGALSVAFLHEPVSEVTVCIREPEDWGRVTGPALRQLQKLGLRTVHNHDAPDELVGPVFDDPRLTGVRSLDLGTAGRTLAPAILTRLLASPLAARLRGVGSPIGANGLAVLATAPPDLPWETVSFSFRLSALLRVPANGLELLAALPFRRNIRELSLAKSPVGNGGVRLLASADGWDRLDRLNLTNAEITDEGLLALAAAPLTRRLTHLRLGGNRVTDAGVRPLAAALDADRVKEFAVAPHRLSAELVAALRDQFGSRFVEH